MQKDESPELNAPISAEEMARINRIEETRDSFGREKPTNVGGTNAEPDPHKNPHTKNDPIIRKTNK